MSEHPEETQYVYHNKSLFRPMICKLRSLNLDNSIQYYMITVSTVTVRPEQDTVRTLNIVMIRTYCTYRGVRRAARPACGDSRGRTAPGTGRAAPAHPESPCVLLHNRNGKRIFIFMFIHVFQNHLFLSAQCVNSTKINTVN